tara:strand:- start:657 stop:1808 length:1152 start_codon:yes stop_codon:yes gene_type:complete
VERSVDFYIKHKISPASRDISNLAVHFQKRGSLFRHLGIIPSFVAGKTVLEFGPGGGHNSTFILSLNPARYVLVDGNPSGLASVEKLFAQYNQWNTQYEIVESFIEDFSAQERFDFVICENVIPLQQDDPKHVLKCVAEFVKPGGVLVITCMDPVSFLADVLKQLAGELMVVPEMTIQEKLDTMRPFFQMNLDTLSGSNILVDDFMMDSIIQHYPKQGKMQSISDTIDILSNDFDVYGASPHFLVDWRYYKDIDNSQNNFNEQAIEQYKRNIHNLLDYRCVSREITDREISTIWKLCDNVFEVAKEFRLDRQHKYLEVIKNDLTQLADLVDHYSQETASSLKDFNAAIDSFISAETWPRLDKFVPFFGRATQYLSLIRRGSAK